MTTTSVSIRMDSQVKEEAEKLFSELGLNMSTAFNIFVRQSIREGGIPFTISNRSPKVETIEALEEARRLARDPSARAYTDTKELLKDLYS